MTQKIIKFIVATFLIWRTALLLFAFSGINFIPLHEDYLGGGIEIYKNNPLLWGWANFDGVHYLNIAQGGYGLYQQAFFPLYPYLLRWLAPVFSKDYLLSGLAISHLALVLALYLLYKLIRLDFEEKIAKRGILYLLLFPTSFYFGSVYTESLFLALVLGSFYTARRKKWLIAGILGAFASATKFVGIFLFPALLIEWYQSRRESKNEDIKSFLPLLFIGFGLLFYMWYLKKTVGDPLYFIHVQPFFGAERTGGKIILLYQVFWRYFKMILTTKADVLYFAVWTELLASILFLALSVFAYLRLRFSYFVFMVLAYITPTLNGTLSSMPRYVLTLFPGFILLALLAEKYRWLKIIYPIIGGILLIISTILFTRGYFVA